MSRRPAVWALYRLWRLPGLSELPESPAEATVAAATGVETMGPAADRTEVSEVKRFLMTSIADRRKIGKNASTCGWTKRKYRTYREEDPQRPIYHQNRLEVMQVPRAPARTWRAGGVRMARHGMRAMR
jgi:hypothetical protein